MSKHEKTQSNYKKSQEYIKLYKKLNEIAGHYIADADNLVTVYNNNRVYLGSNRTRPDSGVWDILQKSQPAFGRVAKSDMDKMVSLLKKMYEQDEKDRAFDQQNHNPDKKAKKADTHEDIKELPSLIALDAMPSDNGERRILNYVLHKVLEKDGAPVQYYTEVWLEDGEIKREMCEARLIDERTAPTPGFQDGKHSTLSEIYQEMHTNVTDYGAFPVGSLDPALIALGAIASYFIEAFAQVPYFDYTSAEAGVGKTTVMKVQAFMAFRGTVSSSTSEAAMFRELEDTHGFYGMDNTESLFAVPHYHAGIIDLLLASNAKGVTIPRVGDKEDENGIRPIKKFDCYSMKAFTHIKDFPMALGALRERCIQIIMQTGIPQKSNPAPKSFIDIRNKMYLARLYEFDTVKKSYDTIVAEKTLPGRMGDLYHPLLAIAKTIDETLYQKVVNFANKNEVERKERDAWIAVLVGVLWEKELYGGQNTKELRQEWTDALIEAELLGDSKVTPKKVVDTLKKLGFEREEKKTNNKTWFNIVKYQVALKAFEYGIITKDELSGIQELGKLGKLGKSAKARPQETTIEIEKINNISTLPPEIPNLVNLVNFYKNGEKIEILKEGLSTPTEEKEPVKTETPPASDFVEKELTKKTGVNLPNSVNPSVEPTKNVCSACGRDSVTTLYNGEWLCNTCLTDNAEFGEDKKRYTEEAP
jgi:hypothetical protein